MVIFYWFSYRESGLSASSGSMEDVGWGTCPSEYPESPPEFLQTWKDERSGVLTGQYPQVKVSWLGVSHTVLSAPASCCRCRRSERSAIWRKRWSCWTGREKSLHLGSDWSLIENLFVLNVWGFCYLNMNRPASSVRKVHVWVSMLRRTTQMKFLK